MYANGLVPASSARSTMHTRLISKFATPGQRFDHVLINIVGPQPSSNGFSYC